MQNNLDAYKTHSEQEIINSSMNYMLKEEIASFKISYWFLKNLNLKKKKMDRSLCSGRQPVGIGRWWLRGYGCQRLAGEVGWVECTGAFTLWICFPHCFSTSPFSLPSPPWHSLWPWHPNIVMAREQLSVSCPHASVLDGVSCACVSLLAAPEESGAAGGWCWSRAWPPAESLGEALTYSLTYPDVRAQAFVLVLELTGLFREDFQPLPSGHLSLGSGPSISLGFCIGPL